MEANVEVEEVHYKEGEDHLLNGNASDPEESQEESQEELPSKIPKLVPMEVDDDVEEIDNELEENDEEDTHTNKDTASSAEGEDGKSDEEGIEENSSDNESEKDEDEGEAVANGDKSEDEEADGEVHEILDDDEEEDEEMKNGEKTDEPIELSEGEGDGDVMIVDEVKENGTLVKRKNCELEVIELDSSPVKKKAFDLSAVTPRRSVRNVKRKSYADVDKGMKSSSEESDIEEVLPQDPLAVSGDSSSRRSKPVMNSSTIVVKDTKRLVEIAAKSNNNSGNKKEPTLVIIDTNSILSGRGPVPVTKSSTPSTPSYPALLPMALPAQATPPPPPLTKAPPSSSTSSTLAPVLPTLTDDMFVVEAPSFIVPYVYEKPPVTDFKDFLKDLRPKEAKAKSEEDEKSEQEEKMDEDDDLMDPMRKSSFFESPLGKFFMDIGINLVQEYVQTDMLKQQKKKRDREGGQNQTTNKTIYTLVKNLEFTKENNEPFKLTMKKCEFCHFKTESALVMAHHLETPHTKNYVYKCNFCTYEARSPHDILFHMEAVHAVRGRLERAPSFHQCPNCPFEDNQKGKLSRHLVACMRKFKPEKNLEAPVDWEPPAKIPRVPKARQGINVSAYQAMKSSQLQFLSKMQLLNNSGTSSAIHRGRGRPSLGTAAAQSAAAMTKMLAKNQNSGMVYKQTMSGGSVLVPTNYQLSGNQVYQQNQKNKSVHQPSISITPLPRSATTPNSGSGIQSKPGDTNSKNSFVICEICDGYIKDLEQLRNHMQWIHKVKIHPKMIYNRPPLNCQKCQFRFFTDQGLERHLLGSHGLVTSSMQDAANKSKDAGRCPVCGRVYQWKLLNHVARDHNMTLKPAHLSYKCTVCTATFGMYKQFENHVYSAHSVVAKRVMDKKNSNSSNATAATVTPASSSSDTSPSTSLTTTPSKSADQIMKPLKINDEITIIPQPAKAASPSRNGGNPGTSKNADSSSSSAKKASSGDVAD